MNDTNSPYYNLSLSPAAIGFESNGKIFLPAEEPPVPGDGVEIRVRPPVA